MVDEVDLEDIDLDEVAEKKWNLVKPNDEEVDKMDEGLITILQAFAEYVERLETIDEGEAIKGMAISSTVEGVIATLIHTAVPDEIQVETIESIKETFDTE